MERTRRSGEFRKEGDGKEVSRLRCIAKGPPVTGGHRRSGPCCALEDANVAKNTPAAERSERKRRGEGNSAEGKTDETGDERVDQETKE